MINNLNSTNVAGTCSSIVLTNIMLFTSKGIERDGHSPFTAFAFAGTSGTVHVPANLDIR